METNSSKINIDNRSYMVNVIVAAGILLGIAMLCITTLGQIHS